MTTRPIDGPVEEAVRVAMTQGMLRRANCQQGLTRELMQHRIARLAAEANERSAAAQAVTAPISCGNNGAAATLRGLADLVERLGATRSPRPADAAIPSQLDSKRTGSAMPGAMPPLAGAAPLKAVGAFRSTWQRLRADQRLRQAFALIPPQAGPLNSAYVVHRALQDLRELGPDYLDALLSQIDSLLWLEQSGGGGPPGTRAVTTKPKSLG